MDEVKIITEERRQKIVEIVNEKKNIRVADIASVLNVSIETVRKDLITLDNLGFIKKSHGGASAIAEINEYSINTREVENIEIKKKIAAKALEFITDKKIIILDSGSTVLYLAKAMSDDIDTTIITNSLPIANSLISKLKHLYFIGGELSEITMSTTGIWSKNSIETLRVDIAFLGTSGLKYHNGPSSKTFADSQTKIDMVKVSNFKIVLTDSSKFNSGAIEQYASWADIDILITDKDAPIKIIKEIQKTTKVVYV